MKLAIHPLVVIVELDGDRLFAQATGTPRFELLATADKDFYVADLDAEVSFAVGSEGPAESFVARFATGELSAKRAF